jgi:hypothetical protein
MIYNFSRPAGLRPCLAPSFRSPILAQSYGLGLVNVERKEGYLRVGAGVIARGCGEFQTGSHRRRFGELNGCAGIKATAADAGSGSDGGHVWRERMASTFHT